MSSLSLSQIICLYPSDARASSVAMKAEPM